MKDLKKKSIDGVIWNLTEKFGVQFIKLFLGVILARILNPADYGLIGMITIFISLSLIFIDSGFGLAYIQKQDTNEEDASTIFYFNLFISTVLYILLWFSAPLISNFYEEPQLVNIIRVLSLVLIINSFGMIQITKLTKEVNFKKKTLLILASTIVSGALGIYAALKGYGVWSLVIQTLSKASIESLGLWVFYKWRPKLHFSISSLKSLLSFSTWALTTNLMATFFENLYFIVIGKFFPAAQLGFYTKAKQFQTVITRTPSNAVGTVAFPVFSKIQDDKVVLKEAMKKFITHIIFFMAPLIAVFIVIAKPAFLILLTEKWLPMVPYFQLLLIAGILYPIQMVNVQVLTAQGKMKLNFNLSMLKNAFRVINIIVMYRFGVLYIIYGEVALSFLALIINTYYTKKFLNYGMLEQLKDIAIMLITAILLTASGWYISEFIDNNYIKAITSALFVLSLYLTIIYVFDKKLFLNIKSIVGEKLMKKI